ncbi:MAG: BlaI/MecI/CopY family transcriptional regulator [Fuerstiella sp.]|nr:BlaI/MecI/CopY family transcriptional regulator [Fuerstiella sp.]MCP4854856.1 BlaI/MecI/CopY family transcriptional regulator [Fuerstiella sp.]
MSRSERVPPTEAELAILRVLWSDGPSTVRAVHEALGGDARIRYTTTLKQLQVMTEKGSVRRDESQRSHIYSTVLKEAETEKSLVKGFVDRVLQGSVHKMVVHALESDKVTDQEIAQIKRLLKQRENRK